MPKGIGYSGMKQQKGGKRVRPPAHPIPNKGLTGAPYPVAIDPAVVKPTQSKHTVWSP